MVPDVELYCEDKFMKIDYKNMYFTDYFLYLVCSDYI